MKAHTSQSHHLLWHGWITGLVFMAFGCLSAFDHVMSLVQGESYYRASGMSEQQIAHFSSVPLWAVLAWTASVWGSLLGATALLLRRRFALPMFSVSVAGSVIYILYSFVFSAGREAMGVLWPMPFIVTALTGFVVVYCWSLIKKGTLV